MAREEKSLLMNLGGTAQLVVTTIHLKAHALQAAYYPMLSHVSLQLLGHVFGNAYTGSMMCTHCLVHVLPCCSAGMDKTAARMPRDAGAYIRTADVKHMLPRMQEIYAPSTTAQTTSR